MTPKMADEIDKYELAKLREEIQRERQIKEVLDQSAKELHMTMDELEQQYKAIENEGNEWKTRFETQEEMNQTVEHQIIRLQDKIEKAKRNLKSAKGLDGRLGSSRTGADTPKSKSTGITINISVSPQAGHAPRDMMRNYENLLDADPAMVKSMEKEKQLLCNQLRDLEWKLDQESKAYHKADNERKHYVLEINTTKGNIDGTKARQRAAVGVQQREVVEMSKSTKFLGNEELVAMFFGKKNDRSLQLHKSPRIVKSNTSRSTLRMK